MRQLWSYAQSHWAALSMGLVITLLASVTTLAQPVAAKAVVDALGATHDLATPLLLLSGLVVLSAIATGVSTWLLDRTGERVILVVRQTLAFRLTRLRVAELDRHEPGTLVTRATSDSTLLRTAATSGLVHLVDGMFSFVATLGLMFALDLRLAIVTTMVLVLVGGLAGGILPRIRAAVTRAQNAVGLLGAALDRALGAARTVKANAAEARETDRIDETTHHSYRAGLTGARYTALISVISELSLQVCFLIVLGVGGAFVAAKSLPVSTLVAFLLALFYLPGPISSLTSGATDLQQGLGAAARLRHVTGLAIEDDVDTVPEQRRNNAAAATSTSRAQGSCLRLEDVCFAYPERGPALQGVSLSIPAQQITALIGASGAGKSTLFALLQRFYDPTAGSIWLGDQDITTMRRAELRARLAWVDQDATLVSGTVADNLRFGAPHTAEEQLHTALSEVGLDDFVGQLPDGVHSEIGTGGRGLSGGQRQRLAIARALLRNPNVLLLDEATSQLDTANEVALQHTLARIADHSTVIVIAHRMSTVRNAHHIAMLNDGVVTATGTHHELLNTSPAYCELASTQLRPQPPSEPAQ